MGIRSEQIQGLQAAVNTAFSQSIAFNSSIPFNKPMTIMAYTITTDTALSPKTTGYTTQEGGLLPGSGVILRVSGSNGAITFSSPFKKDNGSLAFDISTGADNLIYMWYDGTDYWYKISRIWVESSLVSAPVLQSIASATDGTYIDLKFNKPMNSPVGKHSQFSYTIDGTSATFSAAALKGGDDTSIRLTCNTVITNGVVVLASYTPGSVGSLDGGLLIAFSATLVTNNVAAPVADIPFLSSWTFIINPADSSKITRNGSNVVTRIDSSATTAHFLTGGTIDYDPTAKVLNHATGVEMTLDTAVIAPVSGNFTLAMKVRFPNSATVTTYNPLARNSLASQYPIRFTWNASGYWNMRFGTFLDVAVVGGPTGITNDLAFYYVVGTWNGTTYKFWINGVLKTINQPGTPPILANINKVFQNAAPASPLGLKWLSMGEYIADTDIATVNTFLAGL